MKSGKKNGYGVRILAFVLLAAMVMGVVAGVIVYFNAAI